MSHLNFGSSDAQTVTLSFYVKSSLTGTFSGALQNDGANRTYAFEYTISSANTWERKSITIAGDTTGTWLTTNGVGLRIYWDLGAATDRQITSGSWQASSASAATGASQVIANNGATFYITGVQLEVGEGASDFEFLPYDVQLNRCQRYYNDLGKVGHSAYSAVGVMGFIFPTPMRATPTATFSYLGTTNRVYNIQTGAQSTLSSPTVILGTTGVHNMYAFSPTNWAVAIGTGFHIEWTLSAEL